MLSLAGAATWCGIVYRPPITPRTISSSPMAVEYTCSMDNEGGTSHGRARYYFVSYWVREETWVPHESLIQLHPLEWLVLEKRETRNHVHLAAWQEIDRATYERYNPVLAAVDDEFSEPTALSMRPALPES